MNPAALAENHPNCRKNDAGEPLLPNGTPWRQQLLMLGLSSKLLVDAEKALDIRKVLMLCFPSLWSLICDLAPWSWIELG